MKKATRWQRICWWWQRRRALLRMWRVAGIHTVRQYELWLRRGRDMHQLTRDHVTLLQLAGLRKDRQMAIMGHRLHAQRQQIRRLKARLSEGRARS